jgi:uncharacterized protein YdeI (YjbR/CyaY-like superfamily)
MPAAPPVHFESAQAFRGWLAKHHSTAAEIVIIFHTKASGRGGITYPEALDEALCFGWIDGVVHRIDDTRYSRRFTPRKATSIWSLVNIRHVERLTKEGRMMPAGIAAFEARTAARSGVYAFEQKRDAKLTPAYQKQLNADRKAAAFFKAQPPGYRRIWTHWVMSAKREETREKRLALLIAASEAGRRLDAFSSKP